MHDLLKEVELADRLGLGVGEQHRPDYIVSAPAVVLRAAAARTDDIRLTSAVNIISSDDPVRVFQQFATVDLSPMAAPRSWPGAGRTPHRRSDGIDRLAA